MSDRRLLRMVPPLGKSSPEVPQRLADGCVVAEWIDVAAWSPAPYQRAMLTTADVMSELAVRGWGMVRREVREWQGPRV